MPHGLITAMILQSWLMLWQLQKRNTGDSAVYFKSCWVTPHLSRLLSSINLISPKARSLSILRKKQIASSLNIYKCEKPMGKSWHWNSIIEEWNTLENIGSFHQNVVRIHANFFFSCFTWSYWVLTETWILEKSLEVE